MVPWRERELSLTRSNSRSSAGNDVNYESASGIRLHIMLGHRYRSLHSMTQDRPLRLRTEKTSADKRKVCGRLLPYCADRTADTLVTHARR